MVDGLPGPELSIYPFLQTDFLQFSQKKLTEVTRRTMLKSALVGIAALHERNIIHTGRLSISLYLSFSMLELYQPHALANQSQQI